MPAPAGRRRTPGARSHARKPRPPASAPWRTYARVERARVAGGAAGVASHGRCGAGCRPLRGRGVSGGRFAPPARICLACGRRAAAPCATGAAGLRCCGCMQPGARRDDIQPACWAGWLCWARVAGVARRVRRRAVRILACDAGGCVASVATQHAARMRQPKRHTRAAMRAQDLPAAPRPLPA